MEWVKTTAKTVPQAIELALDNLGVDESEAEIVVIEEPRTGLFGRIKGAARVEARIKPVSVRPKADRRNRRGDRKGGKRGKRGNNNRGDNRGDRGGRNRSGRNGGKGGGRDRSNNRSDNQNRQNNQNNGQGDNRNRSQGRSQGQGGGRRRGGKGNGQGRQAAAKEASKAEVTENTAVDQGAGHTNQPVKAQAFAGVGADNTVDTSTDTATDNTADTETVPTTGGGNDGSGRRRRGNRGRGRGRGGNGNTGGAAAAAAAGSANGSDDPADDASHESQQSNRNRNRSRAGSKPAKEETPVEHVDDEVVADHLKDFLGGLTTAFGLDDEVNIENPEPEVMVATVAGQHGLMVGPKGRTLDAIQELARVSTQRSAPSAVRIRVDVGGYRQQRSEAIAAFALKAADKAVDNGVEVKLDPMPASDRKSVHDALTEDDRVETRSIGAEPRRRVLIVPLATDGGEEEE